MTDAVSRRSHRRRKTYSSCALTAALAVASAGLSARAAVIPGKTPNDVYRVDGRRGGAAAYLDRVVKLDWHHSGSDLGNVG